MHFAVLFVQTLAERLDPLFGGIDPGKDNHRQDGQFNSGDRMVGPDSNPDGGQYPYTGGRGHTYNDAIPREDYARTQKANARDDLTDDPQIEGRLVVDAAERRESIRADTDKDTRSDPDRLSRELPFEAHDGTRYHRAEYFRPAKRRNIENGLEHIHVRRVPQGKAIFK